METFVLHHDIMYNDALRRRVMDPEEGPDGYFNDSSHSMLVLFQYYLKKEKTQVKQDSKSSLF